MTYWSQTPYKLGDGAVKYLVTPSATADGSTFRSAIRRTACETLSSSN